MNNEILTAGTRSYTSDPAGNLTRERAGQSSVTYSYTPNGRIETVDFSDILPEDLSQSADVEDRPRSIHYQYDPFERRVARTLYSAPVSSDLDRSDDTLFASTTWFQYDRLGFTRIASWSASSERATRTRPKLEAAIGSRYRYLGNRTPPPTAGASGTTLGLRLLAPCGLLQIAGPGGPLYLTQDPARSVVAITDQSGHPAPPIAAPPFGRLADSATVTDPSPGFAGKDLDPVTRFYDFGMRDYYPLIGRWTTPDPIMAGTNWFAYTENDPINFTDPTGFLLMSVTTTYYQDWNPISARPEGYADVTLGTLPDKLGKASPKQPETIGSSGCLLTAATRIANALNRNESISPEVANNVAKGKQMYVAADTGQIDELTAQSTKALISALTGQELVLSSNSGNAKTLHSHLLEMNADGVEHYVIAQLSDKNDTYTHFVNVQAFNEDGRVIVADTSGTDRFFIDPQKEAIVGLTEFTVKTK